MKIANIACAWPPYAGGMANSAKQISDLMRVNHEVEDFTPYHLKPWLRYGHGALLPQLLFRLRSFDYIYLHYPFFGTAEIVWLFKLFAKHPKLIIHYHMTTSNLTGFARLLSWPSRLIAKSLFNQAEIIVSASLDYVRSSPLRKELEKNPERFREIPFALNLKKYTPSLLHRQSNNPLVTKAQEIINHVNNSLIKRQRRELLFVGGLDRAHYFKGVSILLTALSNLSQDRWQLNIVGDGDLRSEYEALTKKLGLEKSVHFRGRLDDASLIRAYQQADIFILPSTNSHEAFGIVLIEALACGLPVVASDLPGVRRVFTDHQEGLLSAPNDPDQLRQKILYLLDNERTRQKMSLAARRLAQERYGLEKMAKDINRLFV